MSNTTAADFDLPSSEGTPLEGYVYQLDLSVWTALDLLLAKKLARCLTLEPATKEDLETDIVDEPGALAQDIDFNTYHLVIQCKLRNTGPWKYGDLSSLLAHGTRRQKARDRLNDPNIRYLLITNADVDGVARGVRVRDLGDWPLTEDMPATIAEQLPQSAPGRVAVLASMDAEKVKSRIEKLLTTRFRVPLPSVDACRDALGKDALLRMCGAARGVWTREEIETVVKGHGGYVGNSDALEGFVAPTNWTDMKEALATRHAVILVGPSGTGKTRAAKVLMAELRDELPGLTCVDVRGGPEKVLGDLHNPPVAFDIEDPWGRFRLEPTSVPWNDAINGLLSTARPDRKFIVTSRSDVLRESGPKSLAEKWFIHLSEENYGPEERVHLFENRLPGLPRALQLPALRYRKEAVDRLTTPLELQRYFDVLADGPTRDENERQYVERCLTEAHQGSIESSILNNIHKRQDWRWAAVVWGLFKARARQSFTVLPSIQSGLTKRDSEFEDGLEPYVNFLVAGHNLRQTEASLAYYHPRVELGLEQALKEKPELSSRTIRYLVEILIAQDARHSGDWGREGAAHLVEAARTQPKLDLDLSGETQQQLDEWIRARVSSTGPDFEDDLKLAAAVGSSTCAPAELARWLTNTRTDTSWFLDGWWALTPATAEWYDATGKDRATKRICEAFIRQLLSRRDGGFPDDFAEHIGRFSSDLVPAFRDAALSIVKDGCNPNSEMILNGALADLDGFEPVVCAAVAYETELRKEGDNGLWLAIANGEYDEEAAEHYAESEGEEGYSADMLLKGYAKALRRRGGWSALNSHSQAEGLLSAWLHIVRTEDKVGDDEWTAVADVAMNTRYEVRLWEIAVSRWRPALDRLLMKRLEQGSNDAVARIKAAHVLAYNLVSEIPALTKSLVTSGDERRIFELASDLKAAIVDDDDKIRISSAAQVLVDSLPAPLRDVTQAIFDGVQTKPLTQEALAILQTLKAGSNQRLKLAQARALSVSGIDVRDLVSELVLASGDDSSSEIGIIADATELAIQLELSDVIEAALHHRFADVRKHALIALADRSTGPLPSHLLALAEDKGHRVREALLALMKARRHPEHIEALLQLAADTWSTQRHYYNEEANYPIAQRAAELLCEPPAIDDRYVTPLGDIIRKTKDWDVARTLLTALVRNASNESRQRVMRLALRTGAPPLHRLAAEALMHASDHVDAVLAGQISDEQLARRPAYIAFPMAFVVGACAEPDRAFAAAQALAANPTRRALLIPLWLAVLGRDKALATKIATLLPNGLVEALSAAGNSGTKLARDALDEFGDVRVVQEVLSRLSSLFEAR